MIAGVGDIPFPTQPEQLLPAAVMARLDLLDVLSRKMLSGTMPGERRSKRRGRSVEFDDFRDYSPGDDLRHVDWNIYARLDKLYIKLFREEEDLAVNILIDRSASMDVGTPNKLLYAHQLAMGLAHIGLTNHNRVSIATFAPPRMADEPVLSRLTPLRGRRSVRRVGTFLCDSLRVSRGARPAGSIRPEEAFNEALRGFSQNIGQRGLCLILSDFLAPASIEAGLAAIGARTMAGHTDTWCIQVLSPQELDPASSESQGLSGDVRLSDVESHAAADVTVTPTTIDAYRRKFEAARQRFKDSCSQKGIAYLMVPTDTSLSELLTQTARQRGLLR